MSKEEKYHARIVVTRTTVVSTLSAGNYNPATVSKREIESFSVDVGAGSLDKLREKVNGHINLMDDDDMKSVE